jgi:hypothetical protein
MTRYTPIEKEDVRKGAIVFTEVHVHRTSVLMPCEIVSVLESKATPDTLRAEVVLVGDTSNTCHIIHQNFLFHKNA